MRVRVITRIFLCVAVLPFAQCDSDDQQPPEEKGRLQLTDIRIGTYDVDMSPGAANHDAPNDQPIVIAFSQPTDVNTAESSITLLDASDEAVGFTVSFLDNNKTISLLPASDLASYHHYTLTISDDIKGAEGETFPGITVDFKTRQVPLEITSFTIGDIDATGNARIVDVPLSPAIQIIFSKPLDPTTVTAQNIAMFGENPGALSFELSNENKTLTVIASNELAHLSRYRLNINEGLKGAEAEVFSALSRDFYTTVDPEPKFPVISDEALLTLVQQQTFKYFWDFAQPNSGMARERNTSGDLVTSGGSGLVSCR